MALREDLAFPASVFGPVEVGGMLTASLGSMAIVISFWKRDDALVPVEEYPGRKQDYLCSLRKLLKTR